MAIHKFLAEFLKSDKERLLLSYHSHDKKNETVTITATLFDEENIPTFQPFVIRGTYEELTCSENGMGAHMTRYKTEVLTRTSNINQLEREAKELEERNKKLKEKASKPPKIDKNRMAGGVDNKVIELLCDTGVTSDEFKESLAKANMQTLLHCLTLTTNGQKGVGRFKKMASELKKITGVSAEDMGHSYDLPVKAETEKGLTDNGSSEAGQEAIPETSGLNETAKDEAQETSSETKEMVPPEKTQENPIKPLF